MYVRKGITKEYYSFENLDKIQRILQFDCFCDYQIDENSNWIEYQIDRKYCIRLKDFYHQIKQDIVRIHFGQLLDLAQLILKKVIKLQQYNIEHNYIDMNRIWIKLDKNSQFPNIIHQKFIYSIHFTGYQCPFYELSNDQQIKKPHKDQIRQIIKELLQDCSQRVKLAIPGSSLIPDLLLDKMSKNKVDDIVNPIIQLINDNSKDLKQIVNLIISILKDYEYNDQNQTLKNDETNSKDINYRKQKIEEVQKFCDSVYDFGVEKSQLVAETIVNYQTIQILQIIFPDAGIDRDKNKQQEKQLSIEEQYEKINAKQQKQIDELKNHMKTQLDHQLKDKIEKLSEEFKFTFDEDQINSIKNDVIEQTLKLPAMKYFQNTFWLEDLNKNFIEMMKQQASKYLIDLVDERFQLEVQLEILELILSLI